MQGPGVTMRYVMGSQEHFNYLELSVPSKYCQVHFNNLCKKNLQFTRQLDQGI